CAEHAFRLVPGFLVFVFGDRIRHDAAADAALHPAAADDEGADEDVRVHAAVEAEIAQAAAVWPAGGRFEFGNDFHRPDFRGSGHGAAGESSAQEIDRRALRA